MVNAYENPEELRNAVAELKSICKNLKLNILSMILISTALWNVLRSLLALPEISWWVEDLIQCCFMILMAIVAMTIYKMVKSIKHFKSVIEVSEMTLKMVDMFKPALENSQYESDNTGGQDE